MRYSNFYFLRYVALTSTILCAFTHLKYTHRYASATQRVNPTVVVAAIEQQSNALQFASKDSNFLWADKRFVLAAVKDDGYGYLYLFLPPLPNVSLRDMCSDFNLFSTRICLGASSRRQDSRPCCVERNGVGIRTLPWVFSPSRCALFRYALEFATNALRGDKVVVLAAIKKNSNALQFVSRDAKALWADKEFVMVAVKHKGFSLELASEALRADKEVVLTAVKQQGLALGDAAKELFDDFDVMLAAALQDKRVVMFYATAELREQWVSSGTCYFEYGGLNIAIEDYWNDE